MDCNAPLFKYSIGNLTFEERDISHIYLSNLILAVRTPLNSLEDFLRKVNPSFNLDDDINAQLYSGIYQSGEVILPALVEIQDSNVSPSEIPSEYIATDAEKLQMIDFRYMTHAMLFDTHNFYVKENTAVCSARFNSISRRRSYDAQAGFISTKAAMCLPSADDEDESDHTLITPLRQCLSYFSMPQLVTTTVLRQNMEHLKFSKPLFSLNTSLCLREFTDTDSIVSVSDIRKIVAFMIAVNAAAVTKAYFEFMKASPDTEDDAYLRFIDTLYSSYDVDKIGSILNESFSPEWLTGKFSRYSAVSYAFSSVIRSISETARLKVAV